MKFFLRTFAFLACSCAMVWAQGTAQIHGTIQDGTGAAIPGAEVKAIQTDTGLTRTATTGAAGGYVLAPLPIGPYRIEVAKEGFTKAVQTGVVLQVNTDPAVDVELKVGAVNEQVSVEANAALVETRSSGIGQVVQNQQLLDLPLNGRQVTDLITLSGAATQTQTTSNRFFEGQPFIAIAGGAPIGTDYTMDGANHINFLSGVGMPIPFPDMLQEFKVETSGLAANKGNASAVSVVMKSGTNKIHGDLFEFFRNDATNGHPYFAATPSSLKRNQFGGTVGLPIIKNKLFLFGGYQDTITRADSANSQAVVPTAEMLAGDWTYFASSACGAPKTLRAPFAGNKIDPSLFVGPSTYITNKVLASLGQAPDRCGNVTFGAPTKRNDSNYGVRVDYQISDKQTIFGRMLFATQFSPSTLTFTKNLLNSGGIGFDSLAQSEAIGDTYVISPTMVNSFRVGFNRTATLRPPGQDYFSYCDAGVQIYCGYNPTFMGTLTITGGFTMGTSFKSPEDGNIPTSYSMTDDVNWVKGSHQVTFGVGLLHGRFNQFNHFASGGQTSFNGSATGNGLSDFLLGRLNSLFQGLPNSHSIRQTNFDLYVTDTWRINSRLTANAGLRWEPYLPQRVMNGAIYTFDIARYIAGTRSTQFTNAPPGFLYPGDTGFPGDKGIENQWWHFTPRVGLAFDPKGDGKMSIRASYYFGYSFMPGIWREDASGSNPWGGRTTLTSPVGGFVNPWLGIGNPFPYTVSKNVTFTPRGLFLTPNPDYTQRTPNVYSWNLAFQRQVGADWLLSVTYLGSRTMHIQNQNAINPAQIIANTAGTPLGTCPTGVVVGCNATSNTDARRLLSVINPAAGNFFGPVAQYDDGGTQVYHGLLMSAQKRLSRGTTFGANWTWSHCVGPFADINGNGPPADETYTKPGDRNFDHGTCDSDRRHIFNITAGAVVPKFDNRALRMAATGWRLNGIYRFNTGAPIDVQDGADRSLTGVLRQRPNQILSDVYVDRGAGPLTQYLNPAAFQLQPFGTYGNVGWNSVTGPSYWNVDLSLARAFRVIGESQKIEVRVDAFNVSNSFRPSIASTANAGTPAFANVSNAQFGQIRAAQDPRIVQFALKYTF